MASEIPDIVNCYLERNKLESTPDTADRWQPIGELVARIVARCRPVDEPETRQ